MTLPEIYAQFKANLIAGDDKYTDWTAELKQAFRDVFMGGTTFTPNQKEVLHQFWFVAAPPTNQAIIDANALLPSHNQIQPVQTTGGQWVVCMDILTDEATYGPVFPLLKSRSIIKLDPATDFPQDEIV